MVNDQTVRRLCDLVSRATRLATLHSTAMLGPSLPLIYLILSYVARRLFLSSLPQYSRSAQCGKVSPRGSSTHTRHAGFILRTGAQPVVCTRHFIAHTLAALALSSPLLSLHSDSTKDVKTERDTRAVESERRHSWTRRRDDSRAEEHPNRTGAHRGHLCSHVTVGTARPAKHQRGGGGSFASCAA